MSYVGYSPWTDAANYGEGIGSVLSQVLLQRPEMRARIAQQQQEQQQSAQRFPLEQELLQAQVKNVNAQPQYRQDMLDVRRDQNQQRFDIANQGLDQKIAYQTLLGQIMQAKLGQGDRRLAIDQQNVDQTGNLNDAKINKLEQPKVQSPSELNTQSNIAEKVLAQLAGGFPGSGGQTNASVPVLSAAVKALNDPANSGKIPAEVLQKFVGPNVVTNQPGVLGRLVGSEPTVSTNGAKIAVPAQGAQVPPPAQRPVGTKVTTAKGTFTWDGQGWVSVQQ